MPVRIRVGVIGLGFGQYVHIPAFRQDTRCKLTSVCGQSLEKVKDLAEALDLPRSFHSWQQLIESNSVDALSIAVPPGDQARIAAAALAAKIPVLCEKPLAQNLEQAYKILDLSREHKIPAMVDFGFPFIDAWQEAKALVEGGQLGFIRHISVNWTAGTRAIKNHTKTWKTTAEQGGILALFVSHSLHYVEWFLGPLLSLSAHINDRAGTETIVLIQGKYESGALLSLTVCGHAFPGAGHRIEMFGDKGSLILENSSPDFMPAFSLRYGERDDKELREIVPAMSRSDNAMDGQVIVLSRVVRRFLDCLSDRSLACWPDIASAFRAQMLMEAVLKSHRLRSWVKIPEQANWKELLD
jgi:predicted dehydrogenase